MEEIEDQLESDEDDTAFLVTTNSGTGGHDINAVSSAMPMTDYTKQQDVELAQYGNVSSPSKPYQDQYNYYD